MWRKVGDLYSAGAVSFLKQGSPESDEDRVCASWLILGNVFDVDPRIGLSAIALCLP
jgi:hypothetical protein